MPSLNWIGKDKVLNHHNEVPYRVLNKKYGMDEGSLSKTKEMLDDMHKRKIDMADGIYVINVGGYIGESTRSEIEYAKALGKSVDYLERL